MLFWISRLFSLRMEQFSVSWFDGTDDQSQIVHGCQRGPTAARSRPIGVLSKPHWCPFIDELSPSHYSSLRAQEETFNSSCDFMAGWQRFICCLTEDHLVLLDRIESFPPRESWCGHQGSHQIISHFSLVDLLWFDSDFVFYGDFLFYGIVSSLIDYFIFDVFMKYF